MAIDFNHGANRPPIAEEFAQAIDEAMQADNASRPARDYLGGSRLGVECARALQYEYTGAPRKPFKGRTLRIFERGHTNESNTIKRLRLAGFEIQTEDKNGKQYGFSTGGGRIRGHYDGVITKTPLGHKVPCLWEHKCLGAKGFNKLQRDKVRIAYPVYAGQIATYQAYEELYNPCLFTAENADTGELYAELVKFDAKLAQECTDRGVSVLKAVEAGELLPRAYASADFYLCRFCDFHGECWG